MKLVKLNEENYNLLCDMMNEWTNTGEKIIPWSIRKTDYKDYDKYYYSLYIEEPSKDHVHGDTFFAYDESQNIFLGAINIRHYLNEELLNSGGHIGYGIRPSQRKKGYATKMLNLALKECKEININKVLVCCYKDNVSSSKVIQNNKGVLENEVHESSGKITQRYWIKIK